MSPLYELNLLHWEKALQKDLGKSILNLVKFLSGYAAEVRVSFFYFIYFFIFLLVLLHQRIICFTTRDVPVPET